MEMGLGQGNVVSRDSKGKALHFLTQYGVGKQ